MIIGIDPGWASCGISVVEEGAVIYSGHFIPRDNLFEGQVLEGAVNQLTSMIHVGSGSRFLGGEVAYIERYVAYKGIHSDMSESILMFIGAVIHRLESDDVYVKMVRAIDWKPEVCKYLVRTKGFSNPSQSFDKKFSIAAATALSGKSFKTDHEADAVCLSYLGQVEEYNKGKRK